MNEPFLVPTGTIIKDYLQEYNITNKELSQKTGMSQKHISNVLNNKCRLTEEFALKLEKIMPSIKADYWMNYETKYRLHLARENELYSFDEKELENISKRFLFTELYLGLKLTKKEKAIETLKLLKISNFHQFEEVYSNNHIDFFEDGGNKEAIAIWLNLCENEIEIQNDNLVSTIYKKQSLIKNLEKLKTIANTLDIDKSINECRIELNKIGIYLVEYKAIKNCKVRGALTTYKDHPTIYISRRLKRPSIIWFSIFHELSHLILHYNKKDTLIDYDIENNKETEANDYARNFLINREEYNNYIKNNYISKSSIIQFAKTQNIHPSFIVDFLHHDKLIDYSKFNQL